MGSAFIIPQRPSSELGPAGHQERREPGDLSAEGRPFLARALRQGRGIALGSQREGKGSQTAALVRLSAREGTMSKAWKGMDPLAALEDEDDDDDEDEDVEDGESEEEGDGGTAGKEKGKSEAERGDESQEGAAGVAPKKRPREESEGRKTIDYSALSRHGYSGGGSILFVPDAPQSTDPDYSKWGQGTGRTVQRREKGAEPELESAEDRERLRDKASDNSIQRSAAAALAYAEAERQRRSGIAEERKTMSFNQREKRKRDAGMASRGKNYVEEEKRHLRESGVYSGFDG